MTEEQIMQYIKENEIGTTNNIAKLMGITYYRANNMLVNMVIEGKLERTKIKGSKMFLYKIKGV